MSRPDSLAGIASETIAAGAFETIAAFTGASETIAAFTGAEDRDSEDRDYDWTSQLSHCGDP